MKKSHVVLGVTLVCGTVATGVIGNCAGLDADTWPGWLQAIGSIAAILGAFFIADLQSKDNLKAEKARRVREENRKIDIVDALLKKIQELAAEMAQQSSVGNIHYFYGFNQSVLIDLRESIKTIPIMEVPSSEIVFHITALPHALEEVALVFRNVRSDGNEDPTTIYERLFATDIDQRIDELSRLTTEARLECLNRWAS